MSSREQRVSSGIKGLVRRLLVEIPGEDPDSTDEREANAIDFVAEVIERYALSFCNILHNLFIEVARMDSTVLSTQMHQEYMFHSRGILRPTPNSTLR
jgi:hypothetical protein